MPMIRGVQFVTAPVIRATLAFFSAPCGIISAARGRVLRFVRRRGGAGVALRLKPQAVAVTLLKGKALGRVKLLPDGRFMPSFTALGAVAAIGRGTGERRIVATGRGGWALRPVRFGSFQMLRRGDLLLSRLFLRPLARSRGASTAALRGVLLNRALRPEGYIRCALADTLLRTRGAVLLHQPVAPQLLHFLRPCPVSLTAHRAASCGCFSFCFAASRSAISD